MEADVDRCHGYFHGINIKLTKCGGLTPARRMIERARQLGLQVMVGCMTESTVGISAIAQLLPLLDYVDMDGPRCYPATLPPECESSAVSVNTQTYPETESYWRCRKHGGRSRVWYIFRPVDFANTFGFGRKHVPDPFAGSTFTGARCVPCIFPTAPAALI